MLRMEKSIRPVWAKSFHKYGNVHIIFLAERTLLNDAFSLT